MTGRVSAPRLKKTAQMPYDRFVRIQQLPQRDSESEATVNDDDKTREQVEEDANEDLELQDEDADKVAGGFTIKLDETQSLPPDGLKYK